MRENPKTKVSTCDLPCFLICYQKTNMILWSIRIFWYRGSAEIKEHQYVRKKAYIIQKQQPKINSMIF